MMIEIYANEIGNFEVKFWIFGFGNFTDGR